MPELVGNGAVFRPVRSDVFGSSSGAPRMRHGVGGRLPPGGGSGGREHPRIRRWVWGGGSPPKGGGSGVRESPRIRRGVAKPGPTINPEC